MTELEQLLTKHEKFIYSLIKRHKDVPKYSVFEKEDLKQEAVLAFIEAYNKFDPSYGTEFLTYAGTLIKNRLIDFSLKKANQIAMPYMFVEIWEFAHEHNLQVDDAKEIAKMLGVPLKRVVSAFEWEKNKELNSLNETYTNAEGESVPKYEKYCACEDDTTQQIVDEFLSTLDTQSVQVIKLTMDGYSQTEIGKKLDIPQYKVSRILKRAYNKIKGEM